MRRPIRVKQVLWFPSSGLIGSPSASAAILPSALFCGAIFRSVQVGRPPFSRCCSLIIDLGSPLFEGSWARTWSQSPELGGGARLFRSNSTPRRSPLCGCSAVAHKLPRLPTTCGAARPTCAPRQRPRVSWHSFLPARPALVPSAADHCPVQKAPECSAPLAPAVFSGKQKRLSECGKSGPEYAHIQFPKDRTPVSKE